jgi:uncharacterized protein YecA (UPF0149 family)
MLAPKSWRRERSTLITDAIDELEGWVCFHPDEYAPVKPATEELPMTLPPESSPALPDYYEPPRPVVSPPKIGRNEPCPCGSGKKFKKCCGK